MTPSEQWVREIREAMGAKRLSARKLAELAGVNRGTLSKVLRGEAKLTLDMAILVKNAAFGAEEGTRPLAPKAPRVGSRSVISERQAGHAARLIMAIQDVTGYELDGLREHDRHSVHARWAAAWLLRNVAQLSLQQVGLLFHASRETAQCWTSSALYNSQSRAIIEKVIEREHDDSVRVYSTVALIDGSICESGVGLG